MTRAGAPDRVAAAAARDARRPGSARTLLLDVDGTVAPIAPTPEAARVPEPTLSALRALVALGWTVALVSGRPSRQVRAMVPVGGIRIFGSHGTEGSWGEGARPGPEASLRRRLDRLERAGRALVARTPGARLERKPVGLAFHDRRVADGDLRAWRRSLREWLDGQDLDGFETLRGRRVLELRPRGAHKGRVAREPLARLSRPRDRSLVAVGDDRTDEDLFRAIGERGLTVRVGRPGVRTAARERLASPAAVRRFLERLAELDGQAS